MSIYMNVLDMEGFCPELDKVIVEAIKKGNLEVSSIQRALCCGFSRAIQLLDRLVEMQYFEEEPPHKSLITLEEYEEIKSRKKVVKKLKPKTIAQVVKEKIEFSKEKETVIKSAKLFIKKDKELDETSKTQVYNTLKLVCLDKDYEDGSVIPIAIEINDIKWLYEKCNNNILAKVIDTNNLKEVSKYIKDKFALVVFEANENTNLDEIMNVDFEKAKKVALSMKINNALQNKYRVLILTNLD